MLFKIMFSLTSCFTINQKQYISGLLISLITITQAMAVQGLIKIYNITLTVKIHIMSYTHTIVTLVVFPPLKNSGILSSPLFEQLTNTAPTTPFDCVAKHSHGSQSRPAVQTKHESRASVHNTIIVLWVGIILLRPR